MFKNVLFSSLVALTLQMPVYAANAHLDAEVYSQTAKYVQSAKHDIYCVVRSHCPIDYKALAAARKRGIQVNLVNVQLADGLDDSELAEKAGIKDGTLIPWESTNLKEDAQPSAYMVIDNASMFITTFESTGHDGAKFATFWQTKVVTGKDIELNLNKYHIAIK